MAQKVIVQITDDLGGKGEATTVRFGLDGAMYEIDLNEENAERLRGTLADYVDHGRRTGGRLQRNTRPASTNEGVDPNRAQKIRAWAAEHLDEPLSPRGRIPIRVEAQYDEWVTEQDKPAPKRKRVATAARKGTRKAAPKSAPPKFSSAHSGKRA